MVLHLFIHTNNAIDDSYLVYCPVPFTMCSELTDKGNSAITGTISSIFPFLWSRKEEPRHRPSPSWQHSSNKIQRLERESSPCLCAGIVSLAYAQGIAFPWTPKFSYHESRVILMNKKGIRQFSPEMRLRSKDRWRIKGASPSGTSRGPTFSPKFHLNALNLGRNDMKQAIVRNHEAVQHPNPRFCTPEVEPVSHSNSRATSGGHSPIGQRVLRPRDCAGP